MELQTEMNKLSLSKRREQSARLLSKFAPKLPVIVERARTRDPAIDKSKFLIDPHVTMAELLAIIRKRVQIQPSEGVYLFVNNELAPTNATVFEIYHRSQQINPDGFLYVTYCLENTFG